MNISKKAIREAIDSIINESTFCRLAISEKGRSYSAILFFGYDGSSLYFYGFPEGEKIDALRKNRRVCFELDSDGESIQSDRVCHRNVRYKSVVGYGEARFIEDIDAKMRALEIIMRNYSEQSFEYSEKEVEKTDVIRVDIETVTGKISECREPWLLSMV